MKPRLSISSCWSQLGHWCCLSWVVLVLFSAEEGKGRAQHGQQKQEDSLTRGSCLPIQASDLNQPGVPEGNVESYMLWPGWRKSS